MIQMLKVICLEMQKALSSKILEKCRCISAIGGRGKLILISNWLFHAITFERKVLSKIHELKIE